MHELEQVEAEIRRLTAHEPPAPNDNAKDYAFAAFIGGVMLMHHDGQWAAAIIGAAYAAKTLFDHLKTKHAYVCWSWDMRRLTARRHLIAETAPESLAHELAAFDEHVAGTEIARRTMRASAVWLLIDRAASRWSRLTSAL